MKVRELFENWRIEDNPLKLLVALDTKVITRERAEMLAKNMVKKYKNIFNDYNSYDDVLMYMRKKIGG